MRQSLLLSLPSVAVSQSCLGGLQFDVIMLDVAAPDPMGDPGSLHSIPAQFLAADFIQNGLRRRLRQVQCFARSYCKHVTPI